MRVTSPDGYAYDVARRRAGTKLIVGFKESGRVEREAAALIRTGTSPETVFVHFQT